LANLLGSTWQPTFWSDFSIAYTKCVPHVDDELMHPAFIEAACLRTYRAFADAVAALRQTSWRLQIRPGDRVLLPSDNSVAPSAFVVAVKPTPFTLA
jgi:hypothetical protein